MAEMAEMQINHTLEDTIHNTHWGFEIRLGASTVYLRGDEELSWFRIKHGDPQ